jgi:raffinose/stachyose/melibiose transport system permease protein
VWQFINSWNEFIFALLLISEETKRTVQIAIQAFVGRFFFDYGGLFAAMVIIVVPPIIIFIILQEKVIEGLTAGAVKG